MGFQFRGNDEFRKLTVALAEATKTSGAFPVRECRFQLRVDVVLRVMLNSD